MSTLADSFLQDLEDLEEDLEDLNDEANVQNDGEASDDEEIPDAVRIYELEKADETYIVSDLAKRPEFEELLKECKERADTQPSAGLDESDEEYNLVNRCNEMVIKVDREILNIHKFVRDVYARKFPELESIVFTPLEYLTLVKRLKNESDLTQIDMTDILPNTAIMAVTVAASMTTGSPLPPADLEKLLKACNEALHLADCRHEILYYLESRMCLLAPNLTMILGTALAARLITLGGGLQQLARLPSQQLMLLGRPKRSSLTGAASALRNNSGLLAQSEIFYSTMPQFRHRCLKLLAGKCSLAARVDSFRENRDGSVGQELRKEIIEKLIKAQEPPPAPLKKVLPVPDERPKTKRGGKRYRRMKEKYGQTELRKKLNRLKFGTEVQEDYGYESEGEGYGMIGVATNFGKLRMQGGSAKTQMPKKRQIQMLRQAQRQKQRAGGASVVAGTASSLTFTPVQGIELAPGTSTVATNVKTGQQTKTPGSASYFSKETGFLKVQREAKT